MDTNAFQHKQMIRLYNRIAEKPIESIDDMPIKVLKFLYLFSYSEMTAPFAREMVEQGKGIPQIGRTLNETRHVMRKISAWMGRGSN